jgi:hypothetical protein
MYEALRGGAAVLTAVSDAGYPSPYRGNLLGSSQILA